MTIEEKPTMVGFDDRLYGTEPMPARPPDLLPDARGWVLCFSDGCVSWIRAVSKVDGARRAEFDKTYIRNVAADRNLFDGSLWDGCYAVEVERHGELLVDVDMGVDLPTWDGCPRHCDGGTARPLANGEGR